MKKAIAVSVLLTFVIVGNSPANSVSNPPPPGVAITVLGDKEMLEGEEGHIEVMNAIGPVFDHVSGAAVQITVDPEYPSLGVVVPDEVSVDTESTIRISSDGGRTAHHTFKVVNKAEPEQANGETIAQCTFYNDDDQGHTGLAGTGTFSFDKRTVDKISIGQGFTLVDEIISTTRLIYSLSIKGLTVFGTDFSPESEAAGRTDVFTVSLGAGDFAGDIWYSGSGHQAGTAEYMRRGDGRYLEKGWTTSNREYTYDPILGGLGFFGRSDDDTTHGGWGLLVDTQELSASGSGYFDCTLSDENDLEACGGTYTLPHNQWRQISLPCSDKEGYGRTLAMDLFPNIPGSYGTDWTMYEYGNLRQEETSERKYQYKEMDPRESLEQGRGYWIIQTSGGPVTLSMPKGSIPTLVSVPSACMSSKGCFDIPLNAVDEKPHWELVGYPFAQTASLDNVRITSKIDSCNQKTGCNLDDAKVQNIVHNQLWSYTEGGYRKVKSGDTLDPWNGYWLASLTIPSTIKPVKLVVPKP